jgi:site-specific DNA recombinase
MVQAQLESNLKTRRKRAKKQASSLLTGLIEDVAGNRFTPSFTVRRGRRYRYYVSQVAVQNPGGVHDGITRLPAPEIESRVVERLVRFLRSDSDVFDQLHVDGRAPAQLRKQVTEAKKLADRLSSLSPDDLRDVLSRFLRRVIIGEDQIQLMIGGNELRQLLSTDRRIAPNTGPGKKATEATLSA